MRREPSVPAVFSRNHVEYLEHAVAIGIENPSEHVTFRSSKRWSGALRHLSAARGRGLKVYFAAIGGDAAEGEPVITHVARLESLRVAARDGRHGGDETPLSFLPETEAEGDWGGKARTYYSVSGCHPAARPFPISDLVLLKTGDRLSAGFRYSYALVRDLDEQPGCLVANDLQPPPARVEATTQRIIRDTVLVARLKKLHADTCQLCGTRLVLPDGGAYSEGHHLRPLGRPHDGPDTEANILIVCANCHALLDLFAVELSADQLASVSGHQAGAEFLDYHNAQIRTRWSGVKASAEVLP